MIVKATVAWREQVTPSRALSRRRLFLQAGGLWFSPKASELRAATRPETPPRYRFMTGTRRLALWAYCRGFAMERDAVFKARRVANAALTGWLEDHALVVEDGRIEAVVPRASHADTVAVQTVDDAGQPL